MLNVQRWGATTRARHLVVLCHGSSSSAAEMGMLAEAWAAQLPEVAFMAPDGPQPFEQGAPGFQWFSLWDRTPAVLERGAAAAAPLLNAAVDAECARLGIAPDQVALGGFSQGAMMALHAGLRRRPPPACILAYSGALLDTPELAAEISGRPPVLLVHGERDEVVPFARGRDSAAALQRLGIPVQTCWRPGLEHAVDAMGLGAGLMLLRQSLS
ncbi:MAG: alpha/beta hydrolase [Janthinobacterium lividum]